MHCVIMRLTKHLSDWAGAGKKMSGPAICPPQLTTWHRHWLLGKKDTMNKSCKHGQSVLKTICALHKSGHRLKLTANNKTAHHNPV